MSLQPAKDSLLEKEHQIYAKERNFDLVLSNYRRKEKTEYSQLDLLIIAKAYFMNQEYQPALDVIDQIVPYHSTKVLFERTSLKFRSIYLQKRNQPPKHQDYMNLLQALNQFQRYKKQAPGPAFRPEHLDTINMYKQFVPFLQSYSQSKLTYNEKMFEQQEESDRQSHKRTGFPCYLISQQWLQDYKDMKHRTVGRGAYLGPVTNFGIINDIFESYHFKSPTEQHKNIYIFPLDRGHKVISKKLWLFYCSVFAADKQFLPIKRLYQEKVVSTYYGSSSSSIVPLVPMAVQCQKQLIIFQLTGHELVSSELLPLLEKNYGSGQLRHPSNEQASFDYFYGGFEVSQKQLIQWNKILIYETRELPDRLKDQPIFRHLDYRPLNAGVLADRQNGLRGLQNLGNSCYLSSCLQCLSFTKQIVSSLVLRDLSLELRTKKLQKNGKDLDGKESIDSRASSKTNTVDKNGKQVTLALSDVMKQLWRSGSHKVVVPFKFKRYFGMHNTMFQGKTQEDAHQFLLHLLNNVHDDIKQPTMRARRGSSKLDVTTNVDKVKDYFIRHQLEENKSLVTDLFRGIIHTTIRCHNCETASHAFDVFLSLSLPIPYVGYKSLKMLLVRFKGKNTLTFQICLKNLKNMNDIFSIIQKEVINKPINTNRVPQSPPLNAEDNSKKNYMLIGFSETDDPVELWNHGLKNAYTQKAIPVDELLASKKQLILYQLQQKKVPGLQLTLIQYKINYTFSKQQALGIPRFCYINKQILENQEAITFKKFVVDNDTQNRLYEQDIENIRTFIWDKKDFSFTYSLSVYFKRKEKLFMESVYIDRELNLAADIYTLSDCFKEMRNPEILSDGWKCGKCESNKGAQKRESIIDTNNILIISLKRFQANGSKIKNIIQYPLERLDVNQILEEKNDMAKQLYDLYAVCLHQGTMQYGHYRAYCKHFVSKEWYEFDDERVRKVDKEDIVSPHAYMLFYKRRTI